MALIICSFILLIASIILYMVERRDGMFLTPTLLLGGPYSIILIYAAIANYIEGSGINDISIFVPLFSLMYIFIFFCIGRITKNLMYKKNNQCNKRIQGEKLQELKYLKLYHLILIFSSIIIFLFYLKTFGLSTNLVENLISLKSIFSSGIVAHLVNIMNAIFIVAFNNILIVYKNTRKLKRSQIIIYLIWTLFLLASTTKYMLMMFVASLVISYLNVFPEKVKLYKIILWISVFPLLFILVYTMRFISTGLELSELPFEFIISHLKHYITGSFYAFSQVIENGLRGDIGLGIIFAPILNIFNIMFGENLISTVADFINIGSGLETNVFTMFGAFQYEAGVLGTILIIIIIGLFIFINYYKNLSKSTVTKLALYSYLGSSLVISFFNSFHGTLNVWEITIVIILIGHLEKFRIIIK